MPIAMTFPHLPSMAAPPALHQFLLLGKRQSRLLLHDHLLLGEHRGRRRPVSVARAKGWARDRPVALRFLARLLVSWSLVLAVSCSQLMRPARAPARLVLRLVRLVHLALRHLARRRFRLDHCHQVSAYGATSVVHGRHNVWVTHEPREQRRWRACLQSVFAPDALAADGQPVASALL